MKKYREQCYFVAFSDCETVDATIDNLLSNTQVNDGYEKACWAMLFCGEKFSADKMFAEIQRRLNNIPVFGGSVAGISHHNNSQPNGFESLLIVFPHSIPAPIATEYSLKHQHATEAELRTQLSADLLHSRQDTLLFSSQNHIDRNECYSLASLINETNPLALEQYPATIAGVTLLSQGTKGHAKLFAGDRTTENSCLALSFNTKQKAQIQYVKGCIPSSSFFQITQMNENNIVQFNDKPAGDYIQNILNLDCDEELSLLLGKKQGALFSCDDDALFFVQHATISSSQGRSVCLDNTSFKHGDILQLMTQDTTQVRKSLAAVCRGQQPTEHPQNCSIYFASHDYASLEGEPSLFANGLYGIVTQTEFFKTDKMLTSSTHGGLHVTLQLDNADLPIVTGCDKV